MIPVSHTGVFFFFCTLVIKQFDNLIGEHGYYSEGVAALSF